MESFVLLCMPTCSIYVYMCRMFITRIVQGRFYGLDLKKKMVIFKNHHRLLDSSMMKKTTAYLKAKGKKSGSTCSLLG